MEPFLNYIVSKSERGANFYGLLVCWVAFGISIISMLIMGDRNDTQISLGIWMAVFTEFVILVASNVYLIRHLGESRTVRYLWLLLLMSVATTSSLIANHVLWGFFIIPIVFSFRYSNPRYTFITGISNVLWAYIFGWLQIYFSFANNSNVNMRYVILDEPVTVNLRQGIYGIFGPIYETGLIDKKNVYFEYFVQELPSVLMLLLCTWICMVLVRKFSNRLRIKMESLKKTQMLEEQRLRQEEQARQIEQITALNAQLKTQREQASAAKQAAEQANARKTDFLNMMSHEIRTPLNSIIGFTALAKNNFENAEVTKDYLAKITDSSQYLLSLINEIYDINIIESGQMKFNQKEVHLSSFVQHLRQVIIAATNTHQIRFRLIDNTTSDAWVMLDPVRMNQALINLFRCLLRFAQPNDEICFTINQLKSDDPQTSSFEFRLSVNNERISPTLAASQIDDSVYNSPQRTRNEYGVGMSALISRQIIELKGGTVRVEPAENTEFVITLSFPNVSGQAGASDSEQYTSSAINPVGMRVLLAEDNELNQEIIVTQLESLGFQVDAVNDGLEAVSSIMNSHTGTYSFVLMDVLMPRMNGYEATRIIRSIPDAIKSQVPIIAISANVLEQDRQASLDAGMNGHLAKPISLDTLLQEIGRILQG